MLVRLRSDDKLNKGQILAKRQLDLNYDLRNVAMHLLVWLRMQHFIYSEMKHEYVDVLQVLHIRCQYYYKHC